MSNVGRPFSASVACSAKTCKNLDYLPKSNGNLPFVTCVFKMPPKTPLTSLKRQINTLYNYLAPPRVAFCQHAEFSLTICILTQNQQLDSWFLIVFIFREFSGTMWGISSICWFFKLIINNQNLNFYKFEKLLSKICCNTYSYIQWIHLYACEWWLRFLEGYKTCLAGLYYIFFIPLARSDKYLEKCTSPDLKCTSPDLKCVIFKLLTNITASYQIIIGLILVKHL